MGTAGTVPFSPLLCLTFPSGCIPPGDFVAQLAPHQEQSWGHHAASRIVGSFSFLHLLGCWRWTDEPETWKQIPTVGIGRLSLQRAWAAGESRVQLPAAGAGPDQTAPLLIIPCPNPVCAASIGRKPWHAAGVVGRRSPAAPEGAGTPQPALKHYKQNNPTAPGLGCPLRHHPAPACLSRILLLPSPAHVAAQLKAWPKGSDFMQQMHL